MDAHVERERLAQAEVAGNFSDAEQLTDCCSRRLSARLLDLSLRLLPAHVLHDVLLVIRVEGVCDSLQRHVQLAQLVRLTPILELQTQR